MRDERAVDWTISIDSFKPLRITWPDTDIFVGTVQIQLPPHKLKLYCLAPFIQDVGVSVDAPISGLTFDIDQ